MSLRKVGRGLLGSVIGDLVRALKGKQHRRKTKQVFELQPLEQRIFLTAYPSIAPDYSNSNSVVYPNSSYVLDLNPNTDDDQSSGHWEADWGDGNTDGWISGSDSCLAGAQAWRSGLPSTMCPLGSLATTS